jgi:hypothetical protein
MADEEKPKRFMEVVRERIRLRHLNYTTEKHYRGWIHRFILFHGKRHPKEMGEEEIEKFLSGLAINRRCSPSTQNQALNALEGHTPRGSQSGSPVTPFATPSQPIFGRMGEISVLFRSCSGTAT